MDKMYGTTKGPHQYLGLVGTIELDDSSRSLTTNVICNKCIIPNYSHISSDGKVVSTFGKVSYG
jgi:hypothetical protein